MLIFAMPPCPAVCLVSLVILIIGFAVCELVRVAGTGCLSSACLTRHDVLLGQCSNRRLLPPELLHSLATRTVSERDQKDCAQKNCTHPQNPKQQKKSLRTQKLSFRLVICGRSTLFKEDPLWRAVLTTYPGEIVLVPILQCASTLTTEDIWEKIAYFVI